MIELAHKNDCTGCMACVQACPIKAIAVIEDDLGDRYPDIDHVRCVACGKCIASCPAINVPVVSSSQKAYAVWSLDAASRKASASGGAAAELYLQAVADGYYVCGAQYDERLHVVHTVTRDDATVDKYRQSKYVYSDMEPVYDDIRRLLRSGEKVLCISLPCKIAGLLTYLGRPYDNLITVDIVCHGTPPDKHLQEHILSYTSSPQRTQLHFREDNQFLFHLEQSGKRLCRNIGRTDSYLAAFLEGLNYRPACYSCQYASPKRVSDITICDFWGLGQDVPFDHPYTGAVSAVLINTEKGATFFDTARARFFVEERSVEEAVKGNAQLQYPTPRHPKRAIFEEQYRTSGLDKAVAVCLKNEIKNEKRTVQKMLFRDRLRAMAGLFIKRYRS